ncbi:RNA dependent RNA polymerase-domain-containing protein [Phlyctochytrium arcticum]|nr:RNA dependent RNA polymerase-domain-containing protein [Phlyctochytrium arcticum]
MVFNFDHKMLTLTKHQVSQSFGVRQSLSITRLNINSSSKESRVHDSWYKAHLQISIRESFKLNRLVENNVVKYDIGASLTMAPFVYYRKKDKYNFSVASRGEWRRIAFDKLTSLQVFPTDIFYKGMENLQAIVAEVPNTGTLIDHHYKVEFPLVENGVSDQENYFLSVLGHLEQYGLVLHVHRFGHVDYIPREDVPPPFDVLQSQLPYPIKFKLISLISFNNITPYHIDDEFVKLLQKVSSEIAEGVLEQMMKPKERIWDPKEVLREQLKDTESVEQRIQRNETLNYNQRMIRKIIITPTRILYHGPQLELANRILRTYRVHHDKFLRVSFCDDDLLPLPVHNFDGKNDLPFRRIEAILQTGMDICGMKVEFLHYSNSSLRTGGSWFLSPFSRDGDGRTVNADYIQRTIGTFKETTNPALRGARMAQCFSSTTVTGKIAEAMIKEVPDVERNGFCFSDGVGRIGKTIAYNTFGELRKYMRTREGMPSAYQFRMAGAKGVLTLDETIPPNEIHLRPSQIKFMSKHFAVEVCRTSFHSPGYLNHQFVILLESLGISQKVFLELRDESIRELDRALVVPEEAIRVLSENADGEGTSHVLVAMIKSGLFTVKEPFLMNLLGLFRALQLRDIKTRAKILVKDSASLIGVMDETGLLKHDQLFLQFTDPVTQSKKIIKGKIAIMRAPALHPGDVQVVECVDIPELHHLFDVIVFSQHGERPLPNMLSGGDLDGDTFFVTWDERLIPEKSAQPMEYSTKLVVSLEDSTVDNVKKHFVHYMRHNNLGSIDNAWKAWADKSPKGAFDETAMKLATLHSDAVDFAKKGVPAFMDRELRPRSWPDFMEKPAYQSSYQSNKAVGEIYRSVHVDLKLLKDFQPFEEFKYPGYEKYLEDARVTKLAYDRQICAVMNQYEIKSEFELVSGFIFHLAPAAVNNRRPHEAREVVVAAVQNIKKHYRQLFWTKDMQAVAGAQADKLASGNDEEEGAIVGFDMKLSDAIYAKASAWYMAAYDTTLQPKTSAADTPTDNVEQYPSPAASSPLGSENGDAGAAVPNLSEEEKLAAHRRLATASVRKSEKLYQHIDWDMSGRFYSFPWVVYDVLCNRYRQAQPDTKMTMVTLDDL